MTEVIITIGLYLALSLLSIFLSNRFKIPVLIFFLAIGMINVTRTIDTLNVDLIVTLCKLSLAIILFSGANDTKYSSIKKVFKPAILLSTLGVCLTALLSGLFIHFLLGFNLIESLLFGVVISTTDAASVFSVLKNVRKPLDREVQDILEIESGCNDPAAYGLIAIMQSFLINQHTSILSGIVNEIYAVIIAIVIGLLVAKTVSIFLSLNIMNSIEKIVILQLATVFIVYGLSELFHANSFLAIYISGLIIGNTEYSLKTFSRHFFDTISWLMQIALFILLGVIIYPSRALEYVFYGTLVALALIFVIRPLVVMIVLYKTKLSRNKKLFIAWSGLKGAVPIIFVLYLSSANIANSSEMLYIVFFVVALSILIQGTLVEKVANYLKVFDDSSLETNAISMYELEAVNGMVAKILVDQNLVSKKIESMSKIDEYLIISIKRNGHYFIPKKDTVLELNDELLFIERSFESVV